MEHDGSSIPCHVIPWRELAAGQTAHKNPPLGQRKHPVLTEQFAVVFWI